LYSRYVPENSIKVENAVTDLSKLNQLMADFRDPRLHHLRFDYSREKFQQKNITFTNDTRAYKAALDEIIKYNNFVNEFNYVLEIATRFQKVLMRKLFKSALVDWAGLFNQYDRNGNGAIE
jgi:hypothetical protein